MHATVPASVGPFAQHRLDAATIGAIVVETVDPALSRETA
jgi:hypothetical protein